MANKRFFLTLILLTISVCDAIGQDSLFEKKHIQRVVANFVQCVKNNQRTKLAAMISYPFSREYPVPSIKTNAEFLKRYDEVFDDSLIKLVSKSNLKKDWGAVGWRGIMFLNGAIWLDYDGRFMCVNYETEKEASIRRQLIEDERKTLHHDIQRYELPIHILETKKHRIRIDEMPGRIYRYASWTLEKKMSEKPDIILTGDWTPDGSGGNHHYTFKSGDYIYTCNIVIMGEEGSPPAFLTVMKGEKEILNERAIILEK